MSANHVFSFAAVAFVVLSLIICFARGPRETKWIGWSGGWSVRRDDLGPKPSDVEETSASEAVLEGNQDTKRDER